MRSVRSGRNPRNSGWSVGAVASLCTVWALARYPTTSQPFQIFPKPRIRLRDTTGILDHDPRHFQANERQTHRHSMVVVRLDLGAVQWPGANHQSVGILFYSCANASQLGGECRDSVGFLVSDM